MMYDTLSRIVRGAIAVCVLLLAAVIVVGLGVTLVPVKETIAQQSEQAQPTQSAPSQPTAPDRDGALILIRTTLLALDQANKTGIYTVLRDLGSPEFQTNSAAKLSELFHNQRRDGLDLAAVAVLEPQLTLTPRIESNGLMHMTGFFASAPLQVHFDLLFSSHQNRWRLFGLSVRLQAADAIPPEAGTEASKSDRFSQRSAKPTDNIGKGDQSGN